MHDANPQPHYWSMVDVKVPSHNSSKYKNQTMGSVSDHYDSVG